MSNQLFKVVGITEHPQLGAKVRFTDDLARRVKQFSKGGATRTDFIELPEPMNKLAALSYMKTDAMFQSLDDQALIDDAATDRTKSVRSQSEPKPRKARITKKEMSLEDIAARGKRDMTAQDLLDAIRPDRVITADSTEVRSNDTDPVEVSE